MQVEAIKALLGRPGVKLDAKDKQGQTPLMVAVRAQQQTAALTLTSEGADLEVSQHANHHMWTSCTSSHDRQMYSASGDDHDIFVNSNASKCF